MGGLQAQHFLAVGLLLPCYTIIQPRGHSGGNRESVIWEDRAKQEVVV